MLAIPMLSAALWATVAATSPGTAPAASQPSDLAELRQEAAPLIDKAMKYFVAHQSSDGGWPHFALLGTDPAITSLITLAFIQHPDYGPNHPIVRRALKVILKFQQPDGGIYSPLVGYGNYTTSISLNTLAAMHDESLAEAVTKAQNWLKGNQWVRGQEGPVPASRSPRPIPGTAEPATARASRRDPTCPTPT